MTYKLINDPVNPTSPPSLPAHAPWDWTTLLGTVQIIVTTQKIERSSPTKIPHFPFLSQNRTDHHRQIKAAISFYWLQIHYKYAYKYPYKYRYKSSHRNTNCMVRHWNKYKLPPCMQSFRYPITKNVHVMIITRVLPLCLSCTSSTLVSAS